MPKRSRAEKGKSVVPSSSSTRTKPLFVSNLAEQRFILLSRRTIISERCVVLQDFEHLNIPQILRNNSLDQFMAIKAVSYTHLTLPTIYSV